MIGWRLGRVSASAVPPHRACWMWAAPTRVPCWTAGKEDSSNNISSNRRFSLAVEPNGRSLCIDGVMNNLFIMVSEEDVSANTMIAEAAAKLQIDHDQIVSWTLSLSQLMTSRQVISVYDYTVYTKMYTSMMTCRVPWLYCHTLHACMIFHYNINLTVWCCFQIWSIGRCPAEGFILLGEMNTRRWWGAWKDQGRRSSHQQYTVQYDPSERDSMHAINQTMEKVQQLDKFHSYNYYTDEFLFIIQVVDEIETLKQSLQTVPRLFMRHRECKICTDIHRWLQAQASTGTAWVASDKNSTHCEQVRLLLEE